VEVIRLVDYPVALGIRQYEESLDLVREFQLIDLDQNATSEAPQDLLALAADVLHRFGPMITAMNEKREQAFRAGIEYIQLEYPVFPQIREIAVEVVRVMAQADDYCRSGALMHLESTPELRALRRWSVEEIVRQYAGQKARPWTTVARAFLAETPTSSALTD
jgi:hypothetical protein